MLSFSVTSANIAINDDRYKLDSLDYICVADCIGLALTLVELRANIDWKAPF